jgi:hypothetical protein
MLAAGGQARLYGVQRVADFASSPRRGALLLSAEAEKGSMPPPQPEASRATHVRHRKRRASKFSRTPGYVVSRVGRLTSGDEQPQHRALCEGIRLRDESAIAAGYLACKVSRMPIGTIRCRTPGDSRFATRNRYRHQFVSQRCRQGWARTHRRGEASRPPRRARRRRAAPGPG